MFYYLKGTLEYAANGAAVIDCGGVGYKLTVSATTLGSLYGLTGGGQSPTVKLYTYFAVREDSVELFGFYTLEELDIFKLLIGISGVGPKAAMAVLSQMSPSSLAEAVARQDVKTISRAPGVGSKTAQRIVLELSGKLAAPSPAKKPAAVKRSAAMSEAQDALVVLGYTRAEAQNAVSAVDGAESLSVEEIIRRALIKL